VKPDKVCGFEKEDGTRCGAYFGLSEQNGYCFHHDPLREAERTAAKSKGGKVAGSKRKRHGVTVHETEAPPRPKTLKDCVDLASWAIVAVLTGKIDARTSDSAEKWIRTMMALLKETEQAEELEALREKVEELSRINIRAVK